MSLSSFPALLAEAKDVDVSAHADLSTSLILAAIGLVAARRRSIVPLLLLLVSII